MIPLYMCELDPIPPRPRRCPWSWPYFMAGWSGQGTPLQYRATARIFGVLDATSPAIETIHRTKGGRPTTRTVLTTKVVGGRVALMHEVTVIEDAAAAEASLDPVRSRLLGELAE